MIQKISLRIKDRKAFTAFLSNTIVVDSNLLLELQQDLAFVYKTYTASRTLVMFGRLNDNGVIEIIENEVLPEGTIKITLYQTNNFIKTINSFPRNSEIIMDIFYELSYVGEFVAKNVALHNDNKWKNTGCAKLDLFKYMPDEIVLKVFDLSTSYLNFKIRSSQLLEIENDTKLEPETDLEISPEIIDGLYFIYFRGKHFYNRFEIDTPFEKDSVQNCIITKEYLKYLNMKEDYTVYINDSSVIFISMNSERKVSMGKVLTRDDDDGDTDNSISEQNDEEYQENIEIGTVNPNVALVNIS
jgi:hypothetical protein